MFSKRKRSLSAWKRLVLPALLLAAAVWAFIAAIPPQAVTIEAGPVGGGYYDNALRYKSILDQHGFETKVVSRPDSLAIVTDVQSQKDGSLIGFTAQDVVRSAVPDVVSLGQVELQPMFTFVQRRAGDVPGLSGLRGKTIVMPPENSATSEVALKLLSINGVDKSNTPISFMPLQDAVGALQDGRFDAGMFLLSASNAYIKALATTPTLVMLSDDHATAESRMLTFLRPVTIPRGIYDLPADLPVQDVSLVAAPVDVVVRKNISPAVAYAMLETMKLAHRDATFVSASATFPSGSGSALPLLPEAESYYRSGVPWEYKELPRNLAVFADRNLAILLALLVITQVYSVWKWLYDVGFSAAEQLGLVVLYWVYRSSSRHRRLSERRLRMVASIEQMLLRQTSQERRNMLIARIRKLSETSE